jgi:hypothetical protein
MKKNDFILIIAVVILCGAIFAFSSLTKKEGSKVVLLVDNKEYATFDLNKDTTYTYKGTDGEYNTFVIKDGYVDMVDANCPDKLCVKQKDIHYNHETIVCLPHKVILEVVGGEEDEVDMIAN